MSAAADSFHLEARDLLKIYPGTVALDHTSLTIKGGSIHGLLGKNGAGKSTIIKVLAGVVHPDEGEVVVNGEKTAIGSAHVANELGFAFAHQEITDVPNLTVAENVMLGLGYPKRGGLVRRRELNRQASKFLDRLEAGIDPAKPVSKLSVAERRLVTIARGLAVNARLFVLDEPTATLTDSETDHLERVLRSLRDDGVAILYVSHRLEEILSLTDEVTVMLDGKDVFRAETSTVDRGALIEQITGSAEAIEARSPHKSPAQAKTLLSVRELTLPGRVHNVSFDLHAGEMLGVAGLVGSGRTELMRGIFGADRPSNGEIWMHDKKVRIRSPRDGINAGIVLLPEDRKREAAILDFSVRQNITLPSLSKFRLAPLLPMPSKRREKSDANDLSKRLRIKVANIEEPARHLSGGNQQKMVLARWLETGADVFIFDEPTQGIDVEGKEDVYELMAGLADQGKGIIFVSSEFAELIGTCPRILVLREGQLVAEMRGGEITEDEVVRACYEDEAVAG
jgi:ABC-type sugar transport system ATPase subunit